MTPTMFANNYAQVLSSNSNGTLTASNVSSNNVSIRLSISLVAGMKYLSGDGSTSSPLVVDLNSLD